MHWTEVFYKEIETQLKDANIKTDRMAPVLLFTNTPGMGKGEILSLRWENVNMERNFITVTAVEAKSKRIRRIPINSELRKLFIKLKLTQNGNRHVLQNPMTGKPFLDFGRSWKTLLSTAGIDGVRFHDCGKSP